MAGKSYGTTQQEKSASSQSNMAVIVAYPGDITNTLRVHFTLDE
jgi:hypothetical protein